MKMCPILTIVNKESTPCQGNLCAWFSQNVAECCFKAIATILDHKQFVMGEGVLKGDFRMTSRILILMLCIMLLLTSWCQASSQVDVFFDGLNKAINFMVASIGLLAQNPPRDVQVIKSRSYILSSSFVLWILLTSINRNVEYAVKLSQLVGGDSGKCTWQHNKLKQETKMQQLITWRKFWKRLGT